MPNPTHRTSTATAALMLAGALCLNACGSGGTHAPAAKKGASTGTTSAAPSASALAGNRPKVVLPAEVKHVYEEVGTGDPVTAAVLEDNARNLEAIDAAITGDRASAERALKFYNQDKALVAVAAYIDSYYDEGRSFVGTTRYYHRHVTLKGATAALSYCADATQTFPKDRRTGKVDRSVAGSAADYTAFTEQLRKNDQGVWQSVEITSGPGAKTCM
ncbi:hypothetical protein ACFYNY_34150 [Streptomyces sp. NPDC006530]|uniref:hypothetical protein n=1 Tax=Streptomyces sp. NPDC006530 TaxID=3364750 RepID=UPI00367C0307